ncbi:bacterio-opsin activator [Halorubrum sp. JWXQ-INN 858]|uniref:helix-turn-helix domain-containing protein n=1 Tax=Halorubrum sp. JWXQ-INN 858 TaxID=2690782 RepID=UPI001358A6CE|nr:helix-turn-helix domain-containing protein [Halorubrum sp. JWXQ-INN 858]MWV65937.1 bacterio-opsin activator [Halorubrum sp. JWXQ-INN 858]
MVDRKETEPSPTESRTHRLYAEFEIEPDGSVSCPLDSFDGEIETIRQQVSSDECRTDTTVTRDDESVDVVHSMKEPDSKCHCPTFLDFDCIPQVTAVGENTIRIETYLPDRERLTELIDGLNEVAQSVSLRRLTQTDAGDVDYQHAVTLDLHDLTEKQREAATNALVAGYYETPRETDIGKLAAQLDISKSAMSQRLNAVESKLAIAAFK